MSNTVKIPFVCVNYNALGETIKYIENVLTLENHEQALIIVVDNSPTDGDYDQLTNLVKEKNYAEDQVVLLKRENRGYFQGLNDGISYAQKLGIGNCSYVVGNNDIIFQHDFIKQIQKSEIKDDIFVLAPDIVTTQGSHENPHVIERIGFLQKLKYDVYYTNYNLAKFLSKFKSMERKFKPYDSVRKEIHMGIGALYVLTPHFFKHFDGFWEDVFLYGEEAILSGQVKSKKGKIIYEPALVCYHNESATTSKMESEAKFHIVKQSYKKYRKYL